MRRKLLYLTLLVTLLPFAKSSAQAPPIAAFAYDPGIDTVWLNSPYTFVNNSINDVDNYWNVTEITGSFPFGPPPSLGTVPGYPQMGSYVYSGKNWRYTFNQVGTYRVRLVSRNTFGVDSVSKVIYVGQQTRKPIANFFIAKQVIGGSEEVPLYDISQNGPTEWYWYLDPACYSCGPTASNNYFKPTPDVQLPNLKALEGGRYGICLVAKNNIGADTFCRPNYIDIKVGISTLATFQDTMTTLREAILFDNGGPHVPDYPGVPGHGGAYITCIGSPCNNQLLNKFYTIAPCASRIDLYVEQFRMRTGDSILIHDVSPTGPVIGRFGGPGVPNPASRNVTSFNGKMVIEYKVNTSTATNYLLDSGFIFRYTSVPATYGPPTPGFTSPEVVYSGYTVNFTNTSTGEGNLSYKWDADGSESDNNPNNNNGYEFDTRDAFWTFTNNNPVEAFYDVCMWVSNCQGERKFCRRITVLPIVTPPVANFTSDRTAGFTTDKFSLTDLSSNGALAWQWTFTPGSVTYLDGTSSTSQHPRFRFNERGRYNVKLKVSNPLGVDSIEKEFFFDVISYSFPNTQYEIGSGHDVGISRVVFANVDTTTALKTPVYDTLFTRKTGEMFRGKVYPIQVFRTTAETRMDRKMWIDLSLDGDFLDPGELIYSEINQNTLVATKDFVLPNTIEPGRVLRLRIGVSQGNSELTADKATSGCFEDYGILVGEDFTKPEIYLLGDSVLRLEVNKPLTGTDPGVLAIDNHEGDISHKYESITDLDSSRVGYYYKKYFVRDLYGNISDTVYRTIQVELNVTGPKLSLNASDSVFFRVKKDTLWKVVAKPTAVDHKGMPMDVKLIRRSGEVDTATLGDYLLTWVVKDEFNYTDTVRQRFYVRDVEAPTINVFGGGNVIKHQIGTAFDPKRSLVRVDNYYSIDELTLIGNGSINEHVPGVYSMNFILCDPSGNCSPPYYVSVDVRDTVPPTVTLRGPNPWLVDVYTSLQDIKKQDIIPWVSDNYYDTSGLVRIFQYDNIKPNEVGEYTIVYRVRDGAGNESSVTRVVQIVDREAPRIELLGASTIDLVWMDTFTDPGVKVIDNYDSDADLQARVKRVTTLDTTADGRYFGGHRGWKEIRYNVSDVAGNVAREMRRTIYVDFRSGLKNAAKTNGSLSVYPNPNNGVFTLTMKEALQGTTTITLYNILGAKVYSETVEAKNLTAHDVSASRLAPGVYVLNVLNNGKQYTQRITIK